MAIIIIVIVIAVGRNRDFAALRGHRQSAHVRSQNASWQQGKTLVSREGRLLVSVLLVVCSRGEEGGLRG